MSDSTESNLQKANSSKSKHGAKQLKGSNCSAAKSSQPTPIWLQQWFRRLSKSCFISMTVHAITILLLSYWTLPLMSRPLDDLLDFTPEEPMIEELDEIPLLEVELDMEIAEDANEALNADLSSESEMEVESQPVFLLEEDLEAAAGSMELVDFGGDLSLLTDFSLEKGMGGEGLEGRGQAARSTMLRRNGGNQASEIAVKESLNWLARHQYPDGTWNFDHQRGSCQGRCSDPGEATKAVRAATGLALLTYLGAGQTHDAKGRYREVVERGAHALVRLMKVSENGGSFHEPSGNMYSHGIASMAICEAYAMTGDPGLRRPAQLAINYISYAQDPQGGGWRYSPRQPGDTSVMGWQVMALKSGYMADLSVSPNTVQGARFFLDSAQKSEGAEYAYVVELNDPRGMRVKLPGMVLDKKLGKLIPKLPGGSKATSAIGLLCRMYLGWEHDNEMLKQGVLRLAKQGPAVGDAYYNYYASQVLFQYTSGKGELWKKWNEKMRSMLVSSQSKEGHEKGSWAFDLEKHHNKVGGRLYCTALASMTLEVYYRYLPVYKTKSVVETKKKK